MRLPQFGQLGFQQRATARWGRKLAVQDLSVEAHQIADGVLNLLLACAADPAGGQMRFCSLYLTGAEFSIYAGHQLFIR
jgi:hypothetical protein